MIIRILNLENQRHGDLKKSGYNSFGPKVCGQTAMTRRHTCPVFILTFPALTWDLIKPHRIKCDFGVIIQGNRAIVCELGLTEKNMIKRKSRCLKHWSWAGVILAKRQHGGVINFFFSLSLGIKPLFPFIFFTYADYFIMSFHLKLFMCLSFRWWHAVGRSKTSSCKRP